MFFLWPFVPFSPTFVGIALCSVRKQRVGFDLFVPGAGLARIYNCVEQKDDIMNTIKIGEAEKSLNETTESWIVQQIKQRQENGPVCVRVSVHGDGIDLLLATPGCGGGSGGGRVPNTREEELIAHWNARHLNTVEWAVGNLIAFLKQTKLLHH
jgi:hypothetical protein